ncbi:MULTISPECIES: MurR/RpiR family transcriptional regulator [Oceanobacillus]|uniref:MurR/RpiR family transcriptional regulator n=1 Tax=Oceanobacillus TaxID=182709 RepID=UPI00186956AE|nr:SIS domain-containing protein [Oceanobacillus oncorhynchi]UUI39933.1 SIS domain-containing protein [Oceanobacillus oncorhynchi]
MLKLDTDHLTQLEKRIHAILSKKMAEGENLKILQAAEICEVSPSKISKLARKLGFDNFKQYKLYFSGKPIELPPQNNSNEIERLKTYLDNFDTQLVDDFVSVFNNFNKIIIYGLGPSYISAEYFAYKLATVTNNNITVTQHEDHASLIADEDTLLIVLSVTGKFASFENLFREMKNKNANIMLLLEEYTDTRFSKADYILYLSKFKQNDNLYPFEKTRTIFFIFIEEIIAKLKNMLSEGH